MPSSYDAVERQSEYDVFLNLVFGLEAHLGYNALVVPKSLRRALNVLSLTLADQFPKTLYRFIEWCHRPVDAWYPLSIPVTFNPSEPILYDRRLSEEAKEFCLSAAEQMQIDLSSQDDVPQTVLDNRQMSELIRSLREDGNNHEVQRLYVDVRSFLIEHSWTTPDQLRQQSRAVFQELREFYEEVTILSGEEPKMCDRCGLLRWRDGRWQGVKPGFCSDHGPGSPYIHSIPYTGRFLRLREGNHLRTFLPGQLERALFSLAEQMQDTYPDHLVGVERYPGLDTYDLRLTFRDEEVWAVDAKDQSYPRRLAAQIKPMYGEGDLAYVYAFYVIPDERRLDADYWEHLEHAVGVLPGNLFIMSVSEFQQRVEQKLKLLSKPLNRKKGS